MAIALSLLVAELAAPPFNQLLCTFSATPQLHRVVGATLVDKVSVAEVLWPEACMPCAIVWCHWWLQTRVHPPSIINNALRHTFASLRCGTSVHLLFVSQMHWLASASPIVKTTGLERDSESMDFKKTAQIV